MRGREETGVRRPESWLVAVFEELATGAGSGSTMVIGTRRRFGGTAAGLDVVETSMGFLYQDRVWRQNIAESARGTYRSWGRMRSFDSLLHFSQLLLDGLIRRLKFEGLLVVCTLHAHLAAQRTEIGTTLTSLRLLQLLQRNSRLTPSKVSLHVLAINPQNSIAIPLRILVPSEYARGGIRIFCSRTSTERNTHSLA